MNKSWWNTALQVKQYKLQRWKFCWKLFYCWDGFQLVPKYKSKVTLISNISVWNTRIFNKWKPGLVFLKFRFPEGKGSTYSIGLSYTALTDASTICCHITKEILPWENGRTLPQQVRMHWEYNTSPSESDLEISLGRGFCTSRPSRLPSGNLSVLGGWISQYISSLDSVRIHSIIVLSYEFPNSYFMWFKTAP